MKFEGKDKMRMSATQQYDRLKTQKALNKVKLLTRFQATLMQAVLQKIDRKSKPIRKQTKVVNECLLKKKIFLEQENFDILTLLQQKQSQNNQKSENGKLNSENADKDSKNRRKSTKQPDLWEEPVKKLTKLEIRKIEKTQK